MRRWRVFAPVALAVLLCTLAGATFMTLKLPLPWMIGPLAMMAFARWRKWPVRAPWQFRYIGQVVIGTALGLYFTPMVAGQVARFLPLMLVGGMFALVCGYLSSLALRRLVPALDVPTAFYSCVPGSATEMAVLAERYGGYQDRVAVAQSLRILMVVSTLPFIFTYGGFHGLDVYHPGTRVVDAGGMALLFGIALTGGFALSRAGLPNAFMLGPLVCSIALSSADINLSALPGWLTNVAQLVLGCSLGAKFEHDFFHTAPRFLLAVAASTVVSALMLAGFGCLLGWAAGIHPATAVLATAPGGIAEMGITARNLQLGVPMVTAFHVSRVVVLVTTASTMYRLVFTRLDRWWEQRAQAKEST
jgi:membrane AbrB-like protein